MSRVIKLTTLVPPSALRPKPRELDSLHAELAEIDENITRANLSPAQQAGAIARRKEIYEELYPETKATYEGGAYRGNQHDEVAANFAATFTKATADATGKSERAIRLAANRGKVLGPALKEIEGTSLDKGYELDALVKMDEGQRAEIIEKAKAASARA
jgi:ParB family transcriptional regulator, chromosome partitioning protein